MGLDWFKSNRHTNGRFFLMNPRLVSAQATLSFAGLVATSVESHKGFI
jgi:hypothetical protein